MRINLRLHVTINIMVMNIIMMMTMTAVRSTKPYRQTKFSVVSP
jgi:hypothetical protein